LSRCKRPSNAAAVAEFDTPLPSFKLATLSLLSNADLKLICFLSLSANYATYLFRQRLCRRLTALWCYINFVLLLLLLLLYQCVRGLGPDCMPTPFSRSPGFPIDNACGHRRCWQWTSCLHDCPLSATEHFPSLGTNMEQFAN